MALYIEGKTACALCGKVIATSKEAILFPPFISNTVDKLFVFNDAVIHVSCLQSNELVERALVMAQAFRKAIQAGNKKCAIDNQLIDNFNDYLFTGIITSDEKEEIYKYNLLTINRKNISQWNDKNLFLSLAKNFVSTGKWISEGNISDFERFTRIISATVPGY